MSIGESALEVERGLSRVKYKTMNSRGFTSLGRRGGLKEGQCYIEIKITSEFHSR